MYVILLYSEQSWRSKIPTFYTSKVELDSNYFKRTCSVGEGEQEIVCNEE